MQDKLGKILGVGQLIIAFFAGLASLGIIHPDPQFLGALLGGVAAAGGAYKVTNGKGNPPG